MSTGMIIFLIALGVVAVIVLFVISVKAFWISRVMSILFALAKVILFFVFLKTINTQEFVDGWYQYPFSYIYAILTMFFFIYLEGAACFDSGTEGVYLICGTLLEDTNHPVSAFFTMCGGSLIFAGLALLLVGFTGFIWFLLIFGAIELILAVALLILNLCN